MRIVEVQPKDSSGTISVLCRDCSENDLRKWVDVNAAFADLDGEPFKAYYCLQHAYELAMRAVPLNQQIPTLTDWLRSIQKTVDNQNDPC